MALLAQDRLLPVEARPHDIARALYGTARDLPSVGPHDCTDPRRFAENDVHLSAATAIAAIPPLLPALFR